MRSRGSVDLRPSLTYKQSLFLIKHKEESKQMEVMPKTQKTEGRNNPEFDPVVDASPEFSTSGEKPPLVKF